MSGVSAADTPGGAETVVHSVTDLSHQFTFYADGRFFRQYLQGGRNKDARNWMTLHKCSLENANLLVLMSGGTPCCYLPEDVRAVREFLEEGGGVALLGNRATFRDQNVYHLNEMATAFGAQFTDVKMKSPVTAVGELGAKKVEIRGRKTIALDSPQSWEILIRDANGEPVMASRPVGRGRLLVASRALFGRQPDASDPINAQWVRPLLIGLAAGKEVDPTRPPNDARWAEVDNVVKHESIELHFNDYMKSEAESVLDLYERVVPVMTELLGVPPSEGMLGSLLLLPTGGGGFSSGSHIGVGVWWGGFPEKEYGMVELIGHEATHSWVHPFPEPMWNEPIATYVGALVGQCLGHGEQGRRAIEGTIRSARKHDPDMRKYDIAFGKDVPRTVQWGKTMWIWEELRKQRPDALARYFCAKRKLAVPGKLKSYTPHDCVAVISHAMGRDMFPWFRAHGLSVSADETSIALP